MTTNEELFAVLNGRRAVMIDGALEEDGDWERLRDRILLLGLESAEPLRILIDSEGGNSDEGLWVHDLLKALPVPTVGIVIGKCHSAAAVILQGCTERTALPHARFLIHSVSSSAHGIHGSARRIREELREMVRSRAISQERVEHALGARLSCTSAELRSVMRIGDRHDRELTAQEALRLGLLDRIVTTMFPPQT